LEGGLLGLGTVTLLQRVHQISLEVGYVSGLPGNFSQSSFMGPLQETDHSVR
jgi:hypothetical protein